MSNDFTPEGGSSFEQIDFTTTTDPAYKSKRVFWDVENDCLAYYNSKTGVINQVGREVWITLKNNTGSIVTNGQMVYIAGEDGGKEILGLANASSASTAVTTLAMATQDIGVGEFGECTVVGTVRFLDTSMCTAGQPLYLDTTDGAYTSTPPSTPNYLVSIGTCGIVDATNGTINVNVNVFNNKQDATAIFNGAIQEKASVTVASDGTTITLSLEKSGGGDLVLYFNNTPELFDTTPAKTVTLTAGSDVSPVESYIYIPESTRTLTASTSGFPTAQHVRIARVICQSASSVQTDGVHKLHAYTEELAGVNENGHLQHVNTRLRRFFADYESGVAPTVTKVTNAGAIDNLYWSNTAGEAYQLHKHTFPAFDMQTGSHAHVINDFTTKYDRITDLGAVDTTTTGTTLRNNNDCYALVVWGVISETSGDSQIFVNAPKDKYATVAEATVDKDKHSIYTIPQAYKGVGFLIARVIIKHETIASGTFTVTVEDLRGQTPSLIAGGGGGSTGGIEPTFAGSDLIPFTNATNDNLDFDATFVFNADASNKEVAMNVLKTNPLADASSPTHFEGYIYYNSDFNCFVGFDNSTKDSNYKGIFLGKMRVMEIYNDTGVQLDRGKWVSWNSAQSSTLPTVTLADADSDEAEDVAGIVIKNIANASTGLICVAGWLVNTDLDYIIPSPSAGDTLYLSTTAGEADTSLPASPAKQVVLGKYLALSGIEDNIYVNIFPKGGSGTATTEFSDAEFRVQDNGDATKQVALECSGITTATTRTLTVPDASGTIVLDTATQTLSGKTLTSPVINTSVSGTAILDEDDMASNSATQLATQQSIKAYVDSNKLSGYSVDHKNVILARNGVDAGQLDFTADVLVVGSYRLLSVSESVDDGASTGVGFIDTGTVATGTWYSQIIVYNPTTADAGMIYSLTKESSNLPSGYTEQRHVGWARYDTTGWYQYRVYPCFANFAPFKERTFVSITTTGTQNYDISAYVPTTAYGVAVVAKLTTTATGSNVTLYSVGGDSTSAQTCQVSQYVASQTITDGAWGGVNSSGNITYTLNVSGTLSGFLIELGGFYQECN